MGIIVVLLKLLEPPSALEQLELEESHRVGNGITIIHSIPDTVLQAVRYIASFFQ
jgi:hypothetical protein